MKLDERLCEALIGLRGNRSFEIVLEKIQAHIDEESKICFGGEGVKLHRAQGAVNALQTWQQMYAEAPAIMEKFKANKQHSQP